MMAGNYGVGQQSLSADRMCLLESFLQSCFVHFGVSVLAYVHVVFRA